MMSNSRISWGSGELMSKNTSLTGFLWPLRMPPHLSCMLLSIGDTGEHSLSACATLKYLSVRIKSYHTYHELEPLG